MKVEAPPPVRLAGVLYLIVLASGTFGEFVVKNSLVSNDAAATARNILTSEQFFRLGFAGDLVDIACYVGVTIILYLLLKPVTPGLAMASAVFSFIGAAIGAAVSLLYFTPLALLSGAPYTAAFASDELASLARMALRLHTLGYNICLLFFGLHMILAGFVMQAAPFLPRVLGWLLALGGLCYLINSGALFVWPSLFMLIYPYILVPAVASELLLALWLLLAGIDSKKWRASVNLRL